MYKSKQILRTSADFDNAILFDLEIVDPFINSLIMNTSPLKGLKSDQAPQTSPLD
jgi:hypothetical protein